MRAPSGRDVATVIGSVKTYLGFLALSILALVAFAYFAQRSPNGTPLYVAIAAVLLLDAIASFIVMTRPEAVGITDQFSDQFATLLGVAVYNGFDPYLRNLPLNEIEEALENLHETLSADRDRLTTQREKKFVEQFAAKIKLQARILLRQKTRN
jgi:hypothetical protein